jgi:hypothetical protein
MLLDLLQRSSAIAFVIAVVAGSAGVLAQAPAHSCVVVINGAVAERWAGSASECATIVLNSKTGATTINAGESVSWLVGQLTVDQKKLVFASAVWRENGGVDTLDATRLAIKTFVDHGVLKR